MNLANADQFAAWNGESGERWVATADRRDDVLAPIADLITDAAAIRRGDRVLDVGCGCGTTTLQAAATTGPTGYVTGVDLSGPMLDLARRRARGQPHIELRQADAQNARFGGPFDVAISRFGTMFFDDPATAFTNIARHLRSGGRMTLVTWQPLEANQWLVVPGAALLAHTTLPTNPEEPGPAMFSQSDPFAIADLLAVAGFADITARPRRVPLTLGATIADAVDHLADTGPGRAVLDTIPLDRRATALADVHAALEPHHLPGRGVVLEAAVLVT